MEESNMIYMAFLHLKRILVQNKRGFIITILFPTIVVSLVAFFSNGVSSNTTINIAVVNNDTGKEGKKLLKILDKSNFSIHEVSYKEGEVEIKRNAASICVVIPKNFTQNIKSGEKPSINIVKALNSNVDTAVLNQFNSYIGKQMVLSKAFSETRAFGIKVNQNKFNREIKDNMKNTYVEVTSRYLNNESTRPLSGILSTNLIINFLMYSMIYIVTDIYELKRKKILKRSMSTPNKNSSILMSILLAMFGLLFIQSSILVFVTKNFLHVYFGKSIMAVMLIFAVLNLVVLSAGLVVVRWAKRETHISSVVSLTVTLTSAVGGSFIPLDSIPNLPSVMKKIAYFTPQKWAVEALNKISLENVGVHSILPHIAVLILFALVFFVIGAAQFRRTINE
ncbi:ABC-2 type transport system permease protein [Clostridium acetobutylicum]|nr:ABC transporter permease [Clostridium acetobutylicum]NOV88000.1 ABC-2 type transport system permease protein [Clostridium acetobutylicum]NOW13656.1 ABC-2 type transport system permease protein [Clostridium acetobutylicum]